LLLQDQPAPVFPRERWILIGAAEIGKYSAAPSADSFGLHYKTGND
jgi:hypothetical protein